MRLMTGSALSLCLAIIFYYLCIILYYLCIIGIICIVVYLSRLTQRAGMVLAQDPSGQVCAWCVRQRRVLLGIRTCGPNVGAMPAMYVHGHARTKLSRAMDALESYGLWGICLCGSPVSSTRCRHADTRGGVHSAGQVQAPSQLELLGNYGGLPRFTPSNYKI